LGHALKLFYYGSLLTDTQFSAKGVLTVGVVAFCCTALGERLLDHANDESFQRCSNRIILVMGLVYLGLGLQEFVRLTPVRIS
jgi:hypothetical protein